MNIERKRQLVLNDLFPNGVPRLWSALLTHYDDHGSPDAQRIKMHFQYVSQYIDSHYVLGTTGDGWELDDQEADEVLKVILPYAAELNSNILLAVLKRNEEATANSLERRVAWLKKYAQNNTQHTYSLKEVMKKVHLCGFGICAPSGKLVSQQEMEKALSRLLHLGYPMALYQIPQITYNEIAPEVVASLTRRFDNLIIVKDTSGNDRIAMSSQDFGGLIFLRGAEGDYSKWINTNHGAYHGFLLGAANCFPRELRTIINELSDKNFEFANDLSIKLSGIMKKELALTAKFPKGNPFTNAAKAFDHFLAYGSSAEKMKSPRLHDGTYLPSELMRATKLILNQYQMMPVKGYLE